MYLRGASLEIHSPDGDVSARQIESETLTIGRSEENNLVLTDPEKNVSRYHCVLEYQDNRWWVLDRRPSANGTFLQQYRYQSPNVEDVRQYGQLRLEDRDRILIPARLIETKKPIYWTLIFKESDPERTNKIPCLQSPELKYSSSQRKLWRVNDGESEEIKKLRPQALNLIHYMATKENFGNNVPSICSVDELIEAIFNDVNRTNNDLTHLVWEVRRKIERDSGEPEFLKTEGRGYSLRVTLLP